MWKRLKILYLEFKMAVSFAAFDAVAADLKSNAEALIAAKNDDSAIQAEVDTRTATISSINDEVKAALGS